MTAAEEARALRLALRASFVLGALEFAERRGEGVDPRVVADLAATLRDALRLETSLQEGGR